MLVDRKAKLHLRAQAIIFYALFIGVVGTLAYLSTQYSVDLDWTAARRNSLDASSITLLGRLQGPIEVKAFATENPGRRELIRKVIGRYQKHKPDLTLVFVDPNTAPDQVRTLGIASDGTLVISMQGRVEKLAPDPRGGYPESDLTNALQRLGRAGERFVVFLDGHGERRHDGEADQDLGALGHLLGERGLKLAALNLATAQRVPDNASVLVIASPQAALLPVERERIAEFVARGGNLLWLVDPVEQGRDATMGLGELAKSLGIAVGPGIVVDPRAALFGSPNPSIIVIESYDPAPFTQDLNKFAVIPVATGLALDEVEGWTARPFLQSNQDSWLETSRLDQPVSLDGKDRAGPIVVGAYLMRLRGSADAPGGKEKEQRIAIVGDGDFASNRFLGEVGNFALAMNMVSWLAQDDDFIDVNVQPTPDATLNLPNATLIGIALGFLIVLPLLLLATGLTIWWRRRRA